MCYAALVSADLRRLERELGARIDFAAFQLAYEARLADPKAFKVPIAIDRHFMGMDDPIVGPIVHDMQGREIKEGERAENVVLQFNPKDETSMFVPCVWSRWQRGDEILYSMALITDEPPVEVAQAGHNRCPINLTREAALAWLAPQGRTSAELFEILSQRHRPYYEHRVAEAA